MTTQTINKLQNKIDGLKAKLTENQDRLVLAQQNTSDFKASLDVLKKEQREVNKSDDTARKQQIIAQLDSIKSQLEESKKTESDFSKAIKSFMSEISTNEKELSKLQKEIDKEKTEKIAEQKKSAALEVLGEKSAKLTQLATDSANNQILAGEIFAQIKNDTEPVKLAFGSFAKFCETTPWDRSTVYLLIQVVENPIIKANYAKLGQKRSKLLLDNKKTTQADVDMALSQTASKLAESLKIEREALESAKDVTIESLMADKSRMLESILQLKNRIALLVDDIAEIDDKILRLQAA